MIEPLFHTYDLGRTIERQRQHLANEVNSMSENEVLNTSQEDMAKYLFDKWNINPLTIDESGIHTDYTDAQIDTLYNGLYPVPYLLPVRWSVAKASPPGGCFFGHT